MKKIGLIGLISGIVGCGDSNQGVKSAFSNLDTVKTVKQKNSDLDKKDGTTFSPFSKIK